MINYAKESLASRLEQLDPSDVKASDLAGEPIVAKLTRAPGNQAAIGGLKVIARTGWFAARPSGTEEIYKLYAESFVGPEHLSQILEQAQSIISDCFSAASERSSSPSGRRA